MPPFHPAPGEGPISRTESRPLGDPHNYESGNDGFAANAQPGHNKTGAGFARDDNTLSEMSPTTGQGAIKDDGSGAVQLKPAYAGEHVEGDVWGEGEGSSGYRNVGWIVSGIFLINLQIGLGVLSMPNTLHTLGLVPGILVIAGVALITTWTDLVIGIFKRGHPSVYTLADVGFILFGKPGREIMGFAYWIYCVLIAGGNLLAFSTAMNAITLHGTCTIVFALVGAIVSIAAALIPTLDRISWLGWVGFFSLMISLITCTIAVGVQDRPDLAPTEGPFISGLRYFNNPGFLDGVGATSNIVLSFAGGPAFFNVISEMRDPRDYNKSVYFCQAWVTATYLILSCLMYYFVGEFISSPALGSAGQLMKRVCYGIVLPGLVAGVVLYVHLPAKFVFVRILRNTRHLTESTWTHWIAWCACILTTCIVAFVICLAVPVFDDLVGLMGALCGTPLAITIPAWMWIWETRRRHRLARRPNSSRFYIYAALNGLLMVVSAFTAVAGVVAAVISINNAVNSPDAPSSFSCADNSNSV